MTTVGTVNGGEAIQQTNQQPMQTVVVVQQPQQTNVIGAGGATNRYPRWAYLVFSIGFFAYHFMFGWFWLGLTLAANDEYASNELQGYGTLFFFGGAVPSLIFWIWMITDSTVFCANGDRNSDPITQICCCQCANGWFMMIPIAIGAVLRFILWCAMFGIFAAFLTSIEGDAVLDNFFWLFLSLVAMDCGPAIYLAIDWFYYYGKQDYDGVLGGKQNPLRCVIAQMSVVLIICWAFVAVFEELVDDAAPYIWPWILYGVVSLVAVVFSVFLWMSGSVKGNIISNPIFRFVNWGLGIAIGILNLIVWGYFLSFAADVGQPTFTIGMILYATYLSSITVPSIFALFSFQVGDTQAVNNQAV